MLPIFILMGEHGPVEVSLSMVRLAQAAEKGNWIIESTVTVPPDPQMTIAERYGEITA